MHFVVAGRPAPRGYAVRCGLLRLVDPPERAGAPRRDRAERARTRRPRASRFALPAHWPVSAAPLLRGAEREFERAAQRRLPRAPVERPEGHEHERVAKGGARPSQLSHDLGQRGHRHRAHALGSRRRRRLEAIAAEPAARHALAALGRRSLRREPARRGPDRRARRSCASRCSSRRRRPGTRSRSTARTLRTLDRLDDGGRALHAGSLRRLQRSAPDPAARQSLSDRSAAGAPRTGRRIRCGRNRNGDLEVGTMIEFFQITGSASFAARMALEEAGAGLRARQHPSAASRRACELRRGQSAQARAGAARGRRRPCTRRAPSCSIWPTASLRSGLLPASPGVPTCIAGSSGSPTRCTPRGGRS